MSSDIAALWAGPIVPQPAYGKCFLFAWPITDNQTDHLHHFRVVEVVDDVFQDVSVRHEAQRSKHDDDGNFLSDVRQRGDDPLTDRALLHPLRKTTNQ